MINNYTEQDIRYLRHLRPFIGTHWPDSRAKLVVKLEADGLDPDLISKFVDERDEPGIHINGWGMEPRFYPHRDSKYLLEFYRSVG